MEIAAKAALFYAVTVAYLLARGVGPRTTLKIVALGLGAGLAVAYTLGLLYYGIVLVKPAATIAVFSMIMLPIAAVTEAREKLLAAITPLGIVLLNVAVVFVPPTGPLPLSFGALAGWLPLQGAPGVAAGMAIVYLPAWIALLALRRGPPGDPVVRVLLGAWVCWVGVAAVAGPAWQAIDAISWDSPGAVLAGLAASYMGVHLLMLALSFFMFFTGDDVAAQSLAASVRIDTGRPLVALAIGVAFWVALWLFLHLTLPREQFGALVLAIALGLAGVLPSRMPSPAPPVPEEPREPPPPLPKLGFVANTLVVGAASLAIAYLLWRLQAWRSAEWRTLADFTREDLVVEGVLVAAAALALALLVGLACRIYAGLAGRHAPRWTITAAAIALVVVARVASTPAWPGWRPPAPEGEGVLAAHLAADAELIACYDNPGTEEMIYSRLAAGGIAHQRMRRAEGWCVHVQAPQREAMLAVLRKHDGSGVARSACVARLGNGVETPVLRCGGS